MSLRASLSPAVRWPSTDSVSELLFDALGHKILAEKASALGRAGRRAEERLEKLRRCADDDRSRARLLKDAADAVYGYFIQRELCGLRRHDAVIRDYAIPKPVLARLGAK